MFGGVLEVEVTFMPVWVVVSGVGGGILGGVVCDEDTVGRWVEVNDGDWFDDDDKVGDWGVDDDIVAGCFDDDIVVG